MKSIFRIVVCTLLIFQTGIDDLFAQCGEPNTLAFLGSEHIYNTACGNNSYQNIKGSTPSGSGNSFKWEVSFSGSAYTEVKNSGVSINTENLSQKSITDFILTPAGNASGDYGIRRIVTNAVGGCSNTSQPVFLYYSQSAATASGGVISGNAVSCSPASGSLNVSGNTGPVLQWESAPSSAGPWTPIANKTNTLAYSGLTSGTCYRALIDNICNGTAGSIDAADIYSTTFCITVNSTPAITVQPLSQDVCIGSGLNLSVTATSSTPMTYQWRKNGFDINGAVSPTYSVGVVSNSDAGTYDVLISNECGEVTSTVAVVTVMPIPIATVPSNSVLCPGATVPGTAFTSTPAGATFTWTNSNTAIGLAASGSGDIPSFIATNVTTSAITATIIVTPTLNGCSGPPSSYIITVNPTAIVTVPADFSVCSGTTIPATNFVGSPSGTTFTWVSTGDAIGLPAPNGSGNVPSFTAVNGGASPLAATITVTPTVNGCAGPPSSYVIAVNPLPEIFSATASNELSCGGNNGTITVTTTGTGPFTYTIVRDAFTQSNGSGIFGPLAPGSYSVLVSNSSGCVATDIATISSPGGPAQPNIISNSSPVCEGNAIIVSVDAPTAGATYTWTGPGFSLTELTGTLNRANATVSMSGDYVVTATSATGCVSPARTFTVVVYSRPVVNDPPDLVYCAGATIPLTSFISTPSGADFSWSASGPSIGLPFTSGSVEVPAFTTVNTTNSPITVTITVTPIQNGCPGTPVDYDITINPIPAVDQKGNIRFCHGSLIPEQAFNSNVSGADFTWTITSLGATFSGSGPIPAFSAVNNGIAPIFGTVTVSASKGGCSGPVMTYTITVDPLPRVTNAPLYQVACAGIATTPVVLTSDVSGATFSWTAVSSSGVTGFTFIGNGDIPQEMLTNSGTVQGTVTYTIIATANGCPGPATTYVVRVDPLPKLLNSISLSQTICSGSASTAVNLSSGVTGTTFNWTATASGSITGFQSSGTNQTQLPSQTLFNSGTTPGTVTYSIVPIADGCSGPVSIYTITVNPLPTATISGNATVCYGADAMLNVALTGTAPWTITYSDGTSFFTISGINTNSYSFPVSATSTKTYTIESVSDAICTNVSLGSATITQPPALTGTATTSGITCFGASDGTITVSNMSGGSGSYQYSIDAGVNWQNAGTFAGLKAGTYSVQMRDAVNFSCVFIVNTSLVLNQPAILTAAVEIKNVTCRGSADGIMTVVNAAGGYGNYEYSKDGGLNWQNSPVFNNIAPGAYNVQVRDLSNSNCVQTLNSSVVVRQADELLVSGVTSQVNVNCFGSTTGAVTLFVRGGVAPYTYSWSNGSTLKDLKDVAAGVYTVIIKDSFNCISSQTISISQPSEPLTINFAKNDVSCFGDSNGLINLTVNGGRAPYIYKWDNGRTTKDITNLSAGSYNISVTDANGCSVSQQIIVDQPIKSLFVNVIKNNVTCFNASDGTIALNVSGGAGPYTYIWSGGQKTSSLTGLGPGVYSVTIVDANGCSLRESVSIIQPSAPLRMSLTIKNTVCKTSSDGMITAAINGGTSPYTILWNGRSQTSNVLTGLAAGSYEITVKDATGCTFIANAQVVAGVCPPVAIDDNFKIYEGSFAKGTTALNDFDKENEKLTFSISAQAKNGILIFNSDGSFTYTPNPGFLGTETVPYKICNTSGVCSSANLIIRVVPFSTVNLTPTISNVREGKKVTVTAILEKVFPYDVIIKIGYSGSAIKDRDYVLLDQFIQIMIPKGQLTTTQKITIAALTDDVNEGDETIIIQILSTSDPEVRIGTGAVVTIGDVYPPEPVEIENNEAPKNPDISIDPLFSPNNDGSGNDVFNIVNIVSFPDNEVFIFNRWGNEVFRMKGYNESDRVFKGYANTGLLSNTNAPLVDGVYFYLITTRRTVNGNTVKALDKGYLILKR